MAFQSYRKSSAICTDSVEALELNLNINFYDAHRKLSKDRTGIKATQGCLVGLPA
jgi:hypothetical protein